MAEKLSEPGFFSNWGVVCTGQSQDICFLGQTWVQLFQGQMQHLFLATAGDLMRLERWIVNAGAPGLCPCCSCGLSLWLG